MPASFSDMVSLWSREFRALVPEQTYRALFGGPPPLTCLLQPGADVFDLVLFEQGRMAARSQMARRTLSRESVERLAGARGRFGPVKIGLMMEAATGFRRRLDVPEQAVRDLPAILVAEIERKTPFNPKEVYSGHRVLDRRDGIARVEHLIVKKDFIDTLLVDTQIAPSDLDFLSLEGEGVDRAGFELRASNRDERFPRRLLAALATTAFGLGVIYAGLVYWDQGERIAALDDAIAQIRPRLADVRTRAQKATEVRQQDEEFETLRTAARFTDVWAELTRRLPDDCWLNELRVTQGASGERLISISGFADSPAQLVRLLEESGTFSNTLLGAAVTFDPVERKQRFNLQSVFRSRGAP